MTESIGRFLVGAGVFLTVFGAVFWAGGKYLRFIGHLPGDFSYRSNGWSFYFPLATSIVVSLFLTLVFSLVAVLLGRKG
jgi:hypothetical protein